MNIGFIYQIYDNTNGNKYYGSTKQKLSKRLSDHRDSYKRFLNGKYSFTTSFKILENGDYTISLIEQVNFNDKIELTARERYFIENNECVNKNVPNRTVKEWYKYNKEQIKEERKEYYEQNKDKIKEYRETNKEKRKEYKKEYYKANKDHLKEYNEVNKEKLREYYKQYRQTNKEQIKEKNKQYNEANKEKIREYYKQYNQLKKQQLNN
jgi:hypothetical protein